MRHIELSAQQPRNTPFILLIMSTLFSYYYIDLGFAFKPYMILLVGFFILNFRSFVIHKIRVYELFLLVFFFYFSLTGMFAKYPSYSLRLILGIILVLFCYFVMRYVMSLASIKAIEKGISIAGLIFNGLSLSLYFAGIAALGFVLQGNQVFEYGVMMDRGLPRLIGLTEDPNMFAFYNLIFFFYYVTHLDKKWSKMGILLASVTMMLSMSRGGIAAVLLGLLLVYFSSSFAKKIKMTIVLPLSLLFMNFVLKATVNINAFRLIIDRFLTDDGASGRSNIWDKGMYFFRQKPIFGIGLFNYQPYSEVKYGQPNYMHNTFMEALVEGGLIGIVLYLLIFIVLIATYYNNRGKIKDNGFLFFTLSAMTVLMLTYSLMVNEMFFMVLALMWRYLYEIKIKDSVGEVEYEKIVSATDKQKKKKKRRVFKRYRVVWK